MKESGLRLFDISAVDAFKEASYFANPPPELVSPDGLIRLDYSFEVHWSPTMFAHEDEE